MKRLRPSAFTQAASEYAVTPRDGGGRPRLVSLKEINASGLPPRGAAEFVCIFPGAAGVHAGAKPPPLPGKNAREEGGRNLEIV